MSGELRLVVSNETINLRGPRRLSPSVSVERVGNSQEAIIACIRPLDIDVVPSEGFRAEMKLRLLEMAPAQPEGVRAA